MNDLGVDNYLVEVGLASRNPDGTVKHIEKPHHILKFLMLSDDNIANTTPSVLEEAIQTLSNYLLFIQLEENKHKSTWVKTKKEYEDLLNIEACKVTGTSVKMREAKVLEQNEKVRALNEAAMKAEYFATLIGNMPRNVIEKINVYKKFYDARLNEQRFGHKPAHD